MVLRNCFWFGIKNRKSTNKWPPYSSTHRMTNFKFSNLKHLTDFNMTFDMLTLSFQTSTTHMYLWTWKLQIFFDQWMYLWIRRQVLNELTQLQNCYQHSVSIILDFQKLLMHSTSPHRHDIIKDLLNSNLLLVRLLQANSPEVAWGASSMPFAVISKNYHGTVLSLKTPKRATGWSWWWPTPSKKTEKLLWQTKLSGLLNFSSRFD